MSLVQNDDLASKSLKLSEKGSNCWK